LCQPRNLKTIDVVGCSVSGRIQGERISGGAIALSIASVAIELAAPYPE
jgi:hypothetical protein